MSPLFIFAMFMISWTTGNFLKETKTSQSFEKVSGRFYLAPSGKFVLHVTNPVNQLVVFSHDTMDIYYPVERQAFRILGASGALGTQGRLGWGMGKEEDFLAPAFIKVGTQQRGDTLIVKWVPKEKGVEATALSGSIQGRLAFIEVQEKKSKLQARSSFISTIVHKNEVIPTKMRTVIELPKSRLEEVLSYDDILFDEVIGDSIAQFKFPKDVVVKTVQW